MEQRELLGLALEAVDRNQAELARRLGRSETTVSRWVTGRNGIDFESALRLARLTGLPPHKVVEACGLDPSLVPAPLSADSIDPDVAALSVVWPSLEVRIQHAIRILGGIGGVSASQQGGFSPTGRAQKGHKRGSNGGLRGTLPRFSFPPRQFAMAR